MVTTRDIARRLGLSHVTVAAALRNSPKCAQSTREIILETAHEMGWRPNPLVTAFQKAVAHGGLPTTNETVAWIVDIVNAENLWQIPAGLTAAKRRAADFGFVLEDYRLCDYGFDGANSAEEAFERVLKVIRNFGIRAVILPIREFIQLENVQSLAENDIALVLLMDEGAAVRTALECGKREVYHRVTSDVFANTQSAMIELQRLGYRRIGFCISDWRDLATGGSARAGYLQAPGDVERFEPCLISAVPPPLPVTPPKHFIKWIERGSFDALLCGNTQVKTWMEHLGYKIPLDMGLAHFELGPAEKNWTGIDPKLEHIAASAVDLVIGHLLRNETGLPSYTKAVYIEGAWKEGKTTHHRINNLRGNTSANKKTGQKKARHLAFDGTISPTLMSCNIYSFG